MKKYIIGIFAILIAVPAFAHETLNKALSNTALKWPTECVLDNGKYNKKGQWIDHNGTVYSHGSHESATECLSKGSLPKTVFQRVGIWGTKEILNRISNKYDQQLQIMMEKARPAVENDNN
tara:strand:- start:223 stop:585 length:363 start_codon:yes stop_codon:yes gene_type:complete